MVKEVYGDYDNVSIDTILSDIDLFRSICPYLKYKIFRSTPEKERYHLVIYNINMPLHIALDIMKRTSIDPSYVALIAFKREFYIRASSKYQNDGPTVPAPELVKEG
jgi:hypothetical protein